MFKAARWCGVLTTLVVMVIAALANAAGTLKPTAGGAPVRIVDHEVEVLINNGFARTEVRQVFHNDSDQALDAVYEFPVPPNAALSELTLVVGDSVMRGEVLPKGQAQQIYDGQRDAEQSAALATQNGFFTYQFDVAQIPADGRAEMSFVYYEKLELDLGVGRYLYPLQDGGTRDAAASFWSGNDVVDGTFRFELELCSAFEVADVRLTTESGATIDEIEPGHFRVTYESSPGALNEDLVFYYRLLDELPPRIEVIPYRAEGAESGTFMMIVTPGTDLAPMPDGADFVYVLDISGSMTGPKLTTMIESVVDSLGLLMPEDRVRVLAFDQAQYDLTAGFVPATPERLSELVTSLSALGPGGSTDLYAGLSQGLASLDVERVVNLVLITDGVTNTGVVEPTRFVDVLHHEDVRLFGMLMGNSANWPLMDLITDASGGYYADVSTADDVMGQIMLMRSKVEHEAFHAFRLQVDGIETEDCSDFELGKVYRGEQVVVFGRYNEAGLAGLTLDTKVSGKDRQYTTKFELPEVAEENPEIERLWALEMIHGLEQQRLLGIVPERDAIDRIVELGVDYQLVTEHTSMLVVADSVFEDNDIERDNLARTEAEQTAQAERAAEPVRDYTVGQPVLDDTTIQSGSAGTVTPVMVTATGSTSPRSSSGSSYSDSGSGGGGGALDPLTVALGFLLAGMSRPRRRGQRPA